MALVKKITKFNKSPEQIKERKMKRMTKKLNSLNKRYPNNKYEIKEGKENIFHIVRTSGKRPHKIKERKK